MQYNNQQVKVFEEGSSALYEITGERLPVKRFIATTEETRQICNDPGVYGLQYTEALRRGCEDILRGLKNLEFSDMREEESLVLHLLRGGLNFGLREALGKAYGWNSHASAFISAQRARRKDAEDEWYITESNYKKVQSPPICSIFFGDVVATGTSCEFALRSVCDSVESQGGQVRNIYFFTIGSPRAEQLLIEIDTHCKERFSAYEGAAVIYFEGAFAVASSETCIQIKIPGTDLLRRDSLLAPEFVESQYGSPAFPLERCTIYDAGSRAFWIPEYLEDVCEYWEQILQLARGGVTFADFLKERFPELDPQRFSRVDMEQLCQEQIRKFRRSI